MSVLVPTVAVLAQANESTTNDSAPDEAGDGNATTGAGGNGTTSENGTAEPVQPADGEDDQVETDERALPAREGEIRDPDAENGGEEAALSAGGAWVLTLSVIVVSLLVGFAVAAAAGDRRG